MAEARMQLLEGLTDAQVRAVTTHEGPLLVLAGPGSGKTMVVTRRMADLIDRGVDPDRLLALTFTNKAAAEMRERVMALVGGVAASRMQVSTFHAFCARQLRRWSDAAGISSSYTIWDTADQREAAKRAVADAGLSTSNWPPAAVLSAISAAKNRLVDERQFEAEATDFSDRMIAKVYRRYQEILRVNDAVDFDDLLRLIARLLIDNESVRTAFQRRWHYVMVDEYQDTNHAQFIIASFLAQQHRNICVVGDPDQSIYRWRGADITNILDFEAQYPEATIVPLGQNFRSTGHIVSAAAGLIVNNQSHRGKDLHTDLEEGLPVRIRTELDEHEEAEAIVRHFQTAHHGGRPWREMAVLYRMNSLSRVLEDAFRRSAIPYVVARGTAFYERKEIKDALAYLRLLLNPNDDIALRRIINVPTRGIGKTTLDRLEQHARSVGHQLGQVIRNTAAVEGLTDRARKAIGRFVTMVDGWHEAMNGSLLGLDLADVVSMVLRDSGLEASLIEGEEGEERVANLAELVSAAADLELTPGEDGELPGLGEQLAAWLESIALVSDADRVDPELGVVTLMTLHAAKGLEFDVVAVAGLEQGVLPHARSLEDPESMEEERRLCYVGMTRARRDLLMTRAMMRTNRGIRDRTMESSFLGELPEEHVDVVAPKDPWGRTGEPDPWASTAGRGGGGTLFRVGDLVEHPRFGLGRIQRVMARPRGLTATIDFEEYGPRTMLVAHAGLSRIDATEE